MNCDDILDNIIGFCYGPMGQFQALYGMLFVWNTDAHRYDYVKDLSK